MPSDIDVRSLHPPAPLLQATTLGVTKTSYSPLIADLGLTQF